MHLHQPAATARITTFQLELPFVNHSSTTAMHLMIKERYCALFSLSLVRYYNFAYDDDGDCDDVNDGDDDSADSDFIWYFAYKITPIHRNETISSSDLRSFLGKIFFLQIHLVESFDILHGCDDDDMTGKEKNFKIQEDLTITIRI